MKMRMICRIRADMSNPGYPDPLLTLDVYFKRGSIYWPKPGYQQRNCNTYTISEIPSFFIFSNYTDSQLDIVFIAAELLLLCYLSTMYSLHCMCVFVTFSLTWHFSNSKKVAFYL